jgi:hypothetical protein
MVKLEFERLYARFKDWTLSDDRYKGAPGGSYSTFDDGAGGDAGTHSPFDDSLDDGSAF